VREGTTISVNHLFVGSIPVGYVGVDDDSYAAAAGAGVLGEPFTSWRRLIMMLFIIAEVSGGVSEPGVPGVYKN
jgi:hypothetical protein